MKLVDIDGNEYNTVKIGEQYWTVENLRATKFNDGSLMTFVSFANSEIYWGEADYKEEPAFCFYNEDAKYGVLYNWYAVNTGKLAPEGWRVPTDADWTKLENYLIASGHNWDGTTSGNKIAKSMAAKTGWKTTNENGSIGNDLSKNNKSGFSALPGGYRNSYGYFYNLSYHGYWWSATENNASRAYNRYLSYSYENLYRYYYSKGCGFSIRLVKE